MVYSYYGLPYDCTHVEPLPSPDQAFLLISSHILFSFASQSPRLLILSDYGKQYVQERASQFPKSVFNDPRVCSRCEESILLDNCHICLTERLGEDDLNQTLLYTVVKGNGCLYSLSVEIRNGHMIGCGFKSIQEVGTDVTSAVTFRVQDTTLLFAGSNTARSVLYSLTHQTVCDSLGDQNSPHFCQLITDEKNHRDDDNYLLYAHGYTRISNHNSQTNFVTRLYLNLSLNTLSSFSLEKPDSNRYHLIQAFHLKKELLPYHSHVVLSDDVHTDVILINGQNLTKLRGDECGFNLRVGCVGLVEMEGSVWGCDGYVCIQIWNKGLKVMYEEGVIDMITDQNWDVLKNTVIRDVSTVDHYVILITAMNEVYLMQPGKQIQFTCLQTSIVSLVMDRIIFRFLLLQSLQLNLLMQPKPYHLLSCFNFHLKKEVMIWLMRIQSRWKKR